MANKKIIINFSIIVVCVLFFIFSLWFGLEKIEGSTGSFFMLINLAIIVTLIVCLVRAIVFYFRYKESKERANILNIIVMVILGLPLILLILLFLGLGTFGG